MNTVKDRFWAKVRVAPGCWEWAAAKNGKGYGRIYAWGKQQSAHRVSYALAYGPIPLGLFVLHHCDNPGCVNPNHLFLGTQKDNIHDMLRKGRHFEQRKTHCPRGHEYTPDNITPNTNGNRACKECARVRTLANYYRNHETNKARARERKRQRRARKMLEQS